MFLLVVYVDFGYIIDKEFEFVFIEYVDEFLWDEFVEIGYEGLELFGYLFRDLIFSYKVLMGSVSN